MHILEALFRGKIHAEGRAIRSGCEHELLSQQRTAERDQFLIELSSEGMAHYNKFDAITGKMEAIETEDAFIEGFQLGVRVVLAGIGEYHGQFYDPVDQ